MSAISVSAILGEMNQERPAVERKPLAARYHAFVDDETDAIEDDSVELSREAQQQAGR